jgi:Trypsin-like peptidase domain
MLPSNIAYRTLFICAEQYGTAFAVDVGTEQYIVTAKHLLPASGDQVPLKFFRRKAWEECLAHVVGRGRGDLDVAVLKVPQRFASDEHNLLLSMGNMTVGQEVFFLGFPYKLWIDYGELLDGLPGPFLKKGTLSAVEHGPPTTLYIDAMNNEGFSGGPLYYCENGNPNHVHIAGVVSKYRTEHESVVSSDGTKTEMTVEYNTGFLVAYDIKHAIALIAAASEA